MTIASVPDLAVVLGRMVDEWKKMTKSDAVPILVVTIVHKAFAQQHPGGDEIVRDARGDALRPRAD